MLVLALAVFAIAPLTYPGFFETHSGFLPTFTVHHLADAPNWVRDADWVRGEGKLPYLLAWPFLKISGDGRAAIRWGYGLAFVLGALGVYGWTRRWLGARSGILASTVYTYLPWHLSAVYVRGAYAEAWLWATWPWILWAIDRTWAEASSGDRRSFSAGKPSLPLRTTYAIVALLAVVTAFWIQPGLCALSIPLFVAYVATVHGRPSRPVGSVLGVLALTFLVLGVMGWAAPIRGKAIRGGFPFLDHGLSAPFNLHFLYPLQLFSSAWGYWPDTYAGASSTGMAPGSSPVVPSLTGGGTSPAPMSFQLGLAAVGLTIVGLALLVRDWPEIRTGFRRAWLFWGASLAVVVLLTLPISAIFWRISGFDAFLTWPWQLLALAGLPLAFLSGSVVQLQGRLAAVQSQRSGLVLDCGPARTTGTAVAGWGLLIAFVVLASYFYLLPRFTQANPGPEPVAVFQAVEADAPELMILETQIAPPADITPTLTLTLTWQAVGPVAEDYTVFVHLLADSETKVAQLDTRPCGGECPINAWQPGEIIVDRYSLTLPADAPAGPYRLAVGLYQLETGQRASVVGRDDGTVYLDVP